MFCDFCSAPGPRWRFGARPFATTCGAVVATSDSGWAACDVCCSLVMADDRAHLLERGIELVPEIPELREWVKIAHEGFFQHRLDRPPVRIERYQA
jgi:hypothetical protein